MFLVGAELQREGIGFIEANAVHRGGRVHVTSVILSSIDDLDRFVIWAAKRDVDFDDARVATDAEIRAHEQLQESL